MLYSHFPWQRLLMCGLLTAGGASTVVGQGFEVLQGFDTPGTIPYGPVTEASDGVLYGTTTKGGANDYGIIFKVNRDGSGFGTLHHFETGDMFGGSAYAGLIEGTDGVLYGTTTTFGVFKINKDGTGFLQVHGFNGNDGSKCYAGVVEGTDGALYGTTYWGGAYNDGVVYKVNKDGTGFLKLHDFNADDVSNGGYPAGTLVEASDGALYGTTYGGGTYGVGTVFKISKDGTGFQKLHDFNKDDPMNGFNPWAGLIEGSDGALYGTTLDSNAGTVFGLNKDGTGFRLLRTFGQQPRGVLVEGSDGALYGTTRYGVYPNYDGSVFKLNKDGTGYQVLSDFSDEELTGREPWAGLFEASDGVLYGTASRGGVPNAGEASGNGVVFQLNKDGTDFRIVHDFTDLDAPKGANPYARLVQGSDGVLYGTTTEGGEYSAGTVFKINRDGTGFLKLRDFDSGDAADGANPWAGLVEGSDGAFYGTTYHGGAYGDLGGFGSGTLFRINKDGAGYLKLHDFDRYDPENGSHPRGALIEGSDGALYGTTQDGGAYGFKGIVYKISKDGTGFTKLTDFYSGEEPYDGVIEASDGYLYGTTYFGGAKSGGVVFKLKMDGTGYVEIHDFGLGDHENGYYPRAGLLEGSDGVLYGTTYLGGTYRDGTVFRLKKDGSGFRVLHDFDLDGDRVNGGYPYGGLIEAFDGGPLYGTTNEGGLYDDGTVFAINKDGTGFLKLHTFGDRDPANGANPTASLIQGADGTLFGTTLNGGPGGGGVVFRLGLGCEASLHVKGDVHRPGNTLRVQVHIAHHRPKTVIVPWELSLIDAGGQVIARHTTAPHTFEPGDIVDRDLEFRLPDHLPAGTYTLELGIAGMAGTKGAMTTFRAVRAE